jgi:hypothetical protein
MSVFNVDAARGPHTELCFRVSLGSLLDCLQMFGAATTAVTSLAMSYSEVRARAAARCRGPGCGRL